MILGKTYFNGTENEKLYLGNNLIYSGVNIDFVISVKTDNSGTSNNNQFTIPTVAGNLYNVTTSDGQILNGNTGDLTITFPSAGTYDINISGDFKQILFNNGGDKGKLLDVKNWGNIAWASFENSFSGCYSLSNYSATDAPDLSNVTNMNGAFQKMDLFNSNINSWDVSNVTDMGGAFYDTDSFNQDLSSWNVSNVTSMRLMFTNFGSSAFNQNLSSWDINQVTNMQDFLKGATLSTINYDATLISWANQIPLSYNGTLNFGSSVYTLGGAAATARAALVSDVGAVSDGGGI